MAPLKHTPRALTPGMLDPHVGTGRFRTFAGAALRRLLQRICRCGWFVRLQRFDEGLYETKELVRRGGEDDMSGREHLEPGSGDRLVRGTTGAQRDDRILRAPDEQRGRFEVPVHQAGQDPTRHGGNTQQGGRTSASADSMLTLRLLTAGCRGSRRPPAGYRRQCRCRMNVDPTKVLNPAEERGARTRDTQGQER
jgi:hypothetical protein